MAMEYGDQVPRAIAKKIQRKVETNYGEFLDIEDLAVEVFGRGYLAAFSCVARPRGRPRRTEYRIAYFSSEARERWCHIA